MPFSISDLSEGLLSGCRMLSFTEAEATRTSAAGPTPAPSARGSRRCAMIPCRQLAMRTRFSVTSPLMSGDVTENRVRIASCLQGIIAQRLLPRADGAGVGPAAEVLVASASVKESIRQPDNNPSLKSLMEKGMHPYGMRTFGMTIHALKEQ